MRPISLIRRGQLQAYIEPVESLGFSPHRILQRVGLSRWLVGASDDWVPLHCSAMAVSLAAKAVGDDQYGFWVAEQSSIDKLAVIGNAVAQAVTVYDALRTVSRLVSYHTSTLRIWLVEDPDKICYAGTSHQGCMSGEGIWNSMSF